MAGGRVEVDQEIDTVAERGEAVGFKAKKLGGGSIETDQKVDTVNEGGTVTGARIDSLD